MLAKREMRQKLKFSVTLVALSCRSTGGEQSGLELKAAFSGTGSQQHHTLNWTSEEKWANFHHLTQSECLILCVCLCVRVCQNMTVSCVVESI